MKTVAGRRLKDQEPGMRQRALWSVVAILAMMIVIFVATAARGVAADMRAGRAFAERNCAACHAIGSSGASPNARAPAFRVLARRYKLEDLEEGLAEGIVTGHNAMPEFTLTPRQIDDLLAYLRRLRRAD
jgi:cytochrome c